MTRAQEYAALAAIMVLYACSEWLADSAMGIL